MSMFSKSRYTNVSKMEFMRTRKRLSLCSDRIMNSCADALLSALCKSLLEYRIESIYDIVRREVEGVDIGLHRSSQTVLLSSE